VILSRYVHERIPFYADLTGLFFFGLWLIEQRSSTYRPILDHPLRTVTGILVLSVFLVIREIKLSNLQRHQRDSIIAATAAVHKHLPRLRRVGPAAKHAALGDLLNSYVQYYEDRFKTKPGTRWEASLWCPSQDEEGQEYLYIHRAIGTSEAVIENYKMGAVAPYHDGLAWLAWKEGKPQLANKADKDPRVDKNQRQYGGPPPYEIGSLACILVEFGDRKYGVLAVDHTRHNMFTNEDLIYGHAFGRLVATILRMAEVEHTSEDQE